MKSILKKQYQLYAAPCPICNCRQAHLGGVVPGVGARGVSQVGVEVGNGAGASDDGLDEEAEHGEHSRAAVLQLLHLKAIRSGQGEQG